MYSGRHLGELKKREGKRKLRENKTRRNRALLRLESGY
jgi:hypothetical protein